MAPAAFPPFPGFSRFSRYFPSPPASCTCAPVKRLRMRLPASEPKRNEPKPKTNNQSEWVRAEWGFFRGCTEKSRS